MLLLLKSSDRVMHDICHAFDACPAPPNEPVRHALMLRKWMALKPERELRCFVRQHDFIGVHRPVLGSLLQAYWFSVWQRKPPAAEKCPALCAAEGKCAVYVTKVCKGYKASPFYDRTSMCSSYMAVGTQVAFTDAHPVFCPGSHITAQHLGASGWAAVPRRMS